MGIYVWILLLTCGAVAGAPTYQMIGGAEVVWEIPEKPKGLIFAAHGCNHAATDWWPKSQDCVNCIGLPEEVNITQRALARGYAVVAISSHDRTHSRCWHAVNSHGMLRKTKDIQAVSSVLTELSRQHNLESLPVYALGASSGGAFVLALPFHVKLAGICAQISGFPLMMFERLMAGSKRQDPSFKYPPTAFVHMPRDEYTASDVFSLKNALDDLEVKSLEVKVDPRPIDKAYLMHKLNLPESKAAKVVESLRTAGVLNDDHLPIRDPRMMPWRDELQKDPDVADIPNAADETPLPEVLNVAFAGHEIISDTTDQVIDWWESAGTDTS